MGKRNGGTEWLAELGGGGGGWGTRGLRRWGGGRVRGRQSQCGPREVGWWGGGLGEPGGGRGRRMWGGVGDRGCGEVGGHVTPSAPRTALGPRGSRCAKPHRQVPGPWRVLSPPRVEEEEGGGRPGLLGLHLQPGGRHAAGNRAHSRPRSAGGPLAPAVSSFGGTRGKSAREPLGLQPGQDNPQGRNG